uniref:Transmembrane protein 138 n=1 Tax=Rhabditophanes sp. KR3021 TaxID=114890 RepID=A0AC35U6M8_9BILA
MSSNFNSGVLVKIAIIILDMLLNALTIIFFHHPTILLMLYILQDVGTIMSIIVLVISFSSTFVFQAGLISYLIIKFRSTIIICFLYLTISVAFHSFSLASFMKQHLIKFDRKIRTLIFIFYF